MFKQIFIAKHAVYLIIIITMSLVKINNASAKFIVRSSTVWRRPADWIPMPTITSTEQKVAALFLVTDSNSNFVAFRCRSAYTVDWGDGIVENFPDNTIAEHNYVYNDLSASTEFGLTGSKYRQAMIVITPQAGQNLTAIDFNQRHSILTSDYATPILEILFSAPFASNIRISDSVGNLRLLQQCTILSHNATTLSRMFSTAISLQSVPVFDTSSVTNFDSLFLNCSSLRNAPALDCSSGTRFDRMFFGCTSLVEIPNLSTGLGTNLSQMFYNCFNLQSVSLDTSSATNMTGMFQSCFALQSVSIDTSLATNLANMFLNCYSLQTIPALDCSSATSIGNFANSCFALKRCQATGIAKSISFLNGSLGPNELNEIYTNLADLTGLPSETITVTGNYGTATDNPAIATAKNWTVVG